MALWRRGLLRRLDSIVSAVFPALDFFLVFMASHLALASSSRFDAGVPNHYQLVIFFCALVTPAWFGRMGVYKPWRGQSVFLEVRKLTVAWLVFFASLAALALVTKAGAMFSRLWMAHAVVLGWVMLVGSRVLVRYILNYFRSRGFNSRFVVLVGDAKRTHVMAEELGEAKWSGLSVVATVNLEEHEALVKLSKILRSKLVDQLWLAMDIREVDRINAVQNVVAPHPIQVMWSPDLVGVNLLNHKVTEVAGMPVVALQDKPLGLLSLALKALEDKLVSSLILVVMAVPMICIAAAIKLTSQGPVIFSQKRHGVSGETIDVLKFRTMYMHHEGKVVESARQGDPRVTGLGRFLRATSLDELPQFINVLRGEMSVVGPRPHSITQEKLFTDYYKLYPMRHKVKPGITGWAQVNGLRGEVDCREKLKQRVEHDIYYLRNWSIWLDLYIIARTALLGWSGKNAY